MRSNNNLERRCLLLLRGFGKTQKEWYFSYKSRNDLYVLIWESHSTSTLSSFGEVQLSRFSKVCGKMRMWITSMEGAKTTTHHSTAVRRERERQGAKKGKQRRRERQSKSAHSRWIDRRAERDETSIIPSLRVSLHPATAVTGRGTAEGATGWQHSKSRW